jgi:hypothetical protein
VELAEGFGEGAVEEERSPVVGGAEEAEDAGHGHDEVEVGDDEEGVVEVLVEDGLGEDGAGEAAGDEEGDEAEGEEHGGGEAGRDPQVVASQLRTLAEAGMAMAMVEMAEGGAGEGVEAGYEHVVSPDEDAEEADEECGGDHEAVGEDAAVAEVGEDHGGEAHAGEDGDVDLGMAEEPEEMEPEEGAAVAAMLEEDAVDEVLPRGGRSRCGGGGRRRGAGARRAGRRRRGC